MKPDTTATAEAPVSEEEASSPFKVKLQRFVIKNMNPIYDDQQGKMYADIRDFNAVCAGDLGSDRTTLKLEAETKSLTYKMNGILSLLMPISPQQWMWMPTLPITNTH